MNTTNAHTFHIPVMGLAYTIDSPIRVAKYGISSVISIMDDELIEKMNAFYSAKFQLPYQEIKQQFHDYRAERITSYLNLVDKIVASKFIEFKNELSESKVALEDYIAMLPKKSELRKGLQNLISDGMELKETIRKFIENHLVAGAIDVNIMTKLDKDNFDGNEQLPIIFNDAHAALRGFANSTLESSVVLSAGMNPRLFSYFESFDTFFPNESFQLKKKIILKVSDFRSAMVQGQFLAKKGLWVSEYRIESGLNCGGHAFATDGLLLGPILDEFQQKKNQLANSTHEIMVKILQQKGFPIPPKPMEMRITVQGGVGTSEEHDFLLDYYKVNSVGWGTPFLLVPEATSVDKETRELLINATASDLYLSAISPLGIPFNTLRGTTNEDYKQKRINQNKAGSSCPKRFLALSKEFDEKGICTSSKKYQDIKLDALEAKKETLSEENFRNLKKEITDKACLCVGLANASYLENDIKIKGQQQGVIICPGPNIAYFDKEVSLSQMVRHIYGNGEVLSSSNRPHFFVKELGMYLDYLEKEIGTEITSAKAKKLTTFKSNLFEGIAYYETLFEKTSYFSIMKNEIKIQLHRSKERLKRVEIPVLEIA